MLMAARKRSTDDPERYGDILELCEKFAFRIYRVASP